MQEFEVVIGLEVHVELSTRSKMFCSCPTAFGAPPNTQVCPVCLGFPGALPVPNREAVAYAVRVGLALSCRVATRSKFDRKNYFYPDLPKAYQISQYDEPLCHGGHVELPSGRRVGITRVHLEEDAGKLVHGPSGTYVDLNRAGVPLIEIVSEPDLRSPAEAREYFEYLRTVVEYLGVSDLRMEEGSMRADANVSLRPVGSSRLGTRTEIKNLNSFRILERALEAEVRRQREVLAAGGEVVQETRGWEEERGVTVSLRTKEEAHDYRYFPEPDLPPLVLDPAWIEEERRNLPELPGSRLRRLVEEDGLPHQDAVLLVRSRVLADFYDACRRLGAPVRAVANWMNGELARLMNQGGPPPGEAPLTPAHLVQLIRLTEEGRITSSAAKAVFEEVYRTGKDPEQVVRERGLEATRDEEELLRVVREVLERHPAAVADLRGGKDKAVGFLIGQVMRATRGRADPKVAERLLRREVGLG